MLSDSRQGNDAAVGPDGAGCSLPIVAPRQFIEAQPLRNKGITRIFAFGNGGEDNPGRQLEWNVFQAVNGKIDAAIEQCLIDFFCEEPFAANLGEGHIQDLVACSFDWDELDIERSCQRFSSSSSVQWACHSASALPRVPDLRRRRLIAF